MEQEKIQPDVEELGVTKNGYLVTFDIKKSHAVTHFKKNPKLHELVMNAIQELSVSENIERHEMKLKEMAGSSDIVETAATDEIVYAMRPLRQQYSRFVKGKTPQPTEYLVVDLRKAENDTYSLYTVYAGRLTPSFPGGDFMPEQSKEFWSNHALVWGSQEIIPGTETTICPW